MHGKWEAAQADLAKLRGQAVALIEPFRLAAGGISG
jgi:hypothetical protein